MHFVDIQYCIIAMESIQYTTKNIPLPYMKEVVFKSLWKQNNAINTVASDNTYFLSHTSTEELRTRSM